MTLRRTERERNDMTNINIDALRSNYVENVAARISYEVSKNALSAADKTARYMNASFDTSRDDSQRLVATNISVDASDAMLDAAQRCDVANFDFINDSKRESNRFNVYALEKVRKLLRAVANNSASMLDKYSAAILLTLAKNKSRDDFYLTREHCYAMFSRAKRYDNVKLSELVRNVNVTANTATTQASSSLRALAAMNVLRFDDETKRVSNIDFDHAVFKLIAE